MSKTNLSTRIARLLPPACFLGAYASAHYALESSDAVAAAGLWLAAILWAVTGEMFAGKALDAERARAERLRAENDRLHVRLQQAEVRIGELGEIIERQDAALAQADSAFYRGVDAGRASEVNRG